MLLLTPTTKKNQRYIYPSVLHHVNKVGLNHEWNCFASTFDAEFEIAILCFFSSSSSFVLWLSNLTIVFTYDIWFLIWDKMEKRYHVRHHNLLNPPKSYLFNLSFYIPSFFSCNNERYFYSYILHFVTKFGCITNEIVLPFIRCWLWERNIILLLILSIVWLMMVKLNNSV